MKALLLETSAGGGTDKGGTQAMHRALAETRPVMGVSPEGHGFIGC